MKIKSHEAAARAFISDGARTGWHDQTLWLVRHKRDDAARSIPEWEQLREWASGIKSHTLSHLDDYLRMFEERAQAKGIHVHWAWDAQEHNRIIYEIISSQRNQRVVKSKSMLTEECGLNSYLSARGIPVVDTDLGEYIVQLRQEHPSHIVMPAIHLKKEDISDTFHEHLGTEWGNSDPQYLTSSARTQLRDHFISAGVAITGVNFAIAESGNLVVCTNEGNADMGVHSASVHIACMGIEKLLPQDRHLGTFLRLLARSATGQAITSYSSHYMRPRAGQEIQVVIVDNGRSRQLGREDFRGSLKCIRCAACFNTCPVYRRSGGHSYHSVIAGPIGSILSPNVDLRAHSDLPFASTLCGSCTHVCPVKIDIHGQLWKWRQEITEAGHDGRAKRLGVGMMSWVLSRPGVYRVAGRVGRWMMRYLPWMVNHRWNLWSRQRELPVAPARSFRDWFKARRRI
jgi:L-lactate dehydrogenase complex protein LldF